MGTGMNIFWRRFRFRAFVSASLLLLPLSLQAVERWYSQSQVDTGKAVFDAYCASCHGAGAAATSEWRKPMADGRYPPPPLNGTAHAWHHPRDAMRLQINQGGAKLGGWMPPMGGVLSDEQVDGAIAYIQSLWTDKIYAAWLEKDLAVTKVIQEKSEAVENSDRRDILLHLSKRLPDSKFGEPEETPLKGIFRLSMDDSIIYVSSDGRYVFLGDMVDLVSGRNISKKGVP